MRVAFLGTPAFAVPALQAIHAAGHTIACVYAQPPRPAGRGQATREAPVHAAAAALGLTVRTPARLRHDADAHAAFAELDLDAAVVAAYGLILPPEMLAAPRRGCLNIHASLLPRWRGAAPIAAAILAGDAQSGVTIMQMDAGLDTGPMLLAQSVPLDANATATWLHDTLAALACPLILRALAHPTQPVPQPLDGVTYAPKLTRQDAPIDWTLPACVIERRVRALNPWPGTLAFLDGQPLKILATRVERADGAPGVTLDGALLLGTGAGALRLLRVQAPGRGALDGDVFVRGRPVPAGTRLG